MRKFILGILFASVAFAQTPAASLVPLPRWQPLDNNGKTVPGGSICTYLTGSYTPAPTYTDNTGMVQNSNPIVLDSAGRANPWWGNGITYRVVFQEPGSGTSCPDTGAVIWSQDGVASSAQVSGSIQVYENSPATNGGYINLTPVTYNPYDSGTTCYDWFGNAVTQPLPANGLPSFGANDILLWNTTSASMPPNSGYPFLPNPRNCGVPLPINSAYGLYTNGLMFARGGFGTDLLGFNTIESFFGGVTAASINAMGFYPPGTVTVNGTLGSAAYLGGYVSIGHSVGPPSAGTINTVSNPLSQNQGLTQGMIYFDDANKCVTALGAIEAETTATLNLSSNTIVVANAAGIAMGQLVESAPGAGIPNNTTVLSVTGTSVVLSNNATASGSGVALNFFDNWACLGSGGGGGSPGGSATDVQVNNGAGGFGGYGGFTYNNSTGTVTSAESIQANTSLTDTAGFYMTNGGGALGIIQWSVADSAVNIGNVFDITATGDIVTGAGHHVAAGTGGPGGFYVGASQVIDGSKNASFVNLAFSGTGPYTAGSGITISGSTISASGGSGGATAAGAAGSTTDVQYNSASGAITSATIDAAGSSYVVGDIITVVQMGASGGTAVVTSVSTGAVTGISLITLGTGYSAAAGLSTTGGMGMGLTITINAVGGVFAGTSNFVWANSTQQLSVTSTGTSMSPIAGITLVDGYFKSDEGFNTTSSSSTAIQAPNGTITSLDMTATDTSTTTIQAPNGTISGKYMTAIYANAFMAQTSGTVPLSGPGSALMYYDSSLGLQISYNGGAYASVSGSGTPGGSVNNVQVNDGSGGFAGYAGFTYSNSTGTVLSAKSIEACGGSTCSTDAVGYYLGGTGVIQWSTALSAIDIGNVFNVDATNEVVSAGHIGAGSGTGSSYGYYVGGTQVIDGNRNASFANLSFSGTGPYSAGTGISIIGSTIYGNYSAGTGISISSGTISGNYTGGTGVTVVGASISIGQSVSTSATVQFAQVQSAGSVGACGTGTCSTNFVGYYIGSAGVIEYSTSNSAINIGNVQNIINNGYTSSTGGFVANGQVGVTANVSVGGCTLFFELGILWNHSGC